MHMVVYINYRDNKGDGSYSYGLGSMWCCKRCNQSNFGKGLMSLVVLAEIVEPEWHGKIVMLGLYTASIIALYHASNMAVAFSDCTLGEPEISSFKHFDI